MFKIITLFTVFFFTPLSISGEITTLIEKNEAGDWSVTYKASNPIKKLVFQRNPDGSRVTEWKPESFDYQIYYENNIESVTRSDGKLFTEVTFLLTPTYRPLPKEYASFSPFSDKGMLFHTGRFFACAEVCSYDLNQWLFRVISQQNDKIIVDGKVHNKEATWYSADSGSKVYVGKGTPLEDHNFVSLIDAQLPEELKEQISKHLPELMIYFSDRMGSLEYRPALFASYSETNDGSSGSQGGILPGQIFMHWYGKKAIAHLNSDSTFWFFAHEVAHLYQKKAGAIELKKDAWLHEGAAEFLAGMASSDVENNKILFQRNLIVAGQRCISDLEKDSNYSRASLQNSKLHYSCGLLLNDAINDDLESRGEGINLFVLWELFNKQVSAGKPAIASTFIEIAKPYLSTELWNGIRLFSATDEFDSLAFFKNLVANKSVTPTLDELAK